MLNAQKLCIIYDMYIYIYFADYMNRSRKKQIQAKTDRFLYRDHDPGGQSLNNFKVI